MNSIWWRHFVLSLEKFRFWYGVRDLYTIGLRASLPRFIGRVLETQYFNVKVNREVSQMKVQENEISQGSVLSTTLFLVTINDLAKLIPEERNQYASLFVDDLQLLNTHTELEVRKRKIQSTVDKKARWAGKIGFRYSTSKTVMMHFSNTRGA